MFNEAHAHKVAQLALDLFDGLQTLHGRGRRDRQFLEVAALLHDIGAFIEAKRHHRHSLYLISRSELPGLSADETLRVANIARDHRKSHPQPTHMEFMKLSRADRIRVEINPEGLRLQLVLHGQGDLLLERWAVQRKKVCSKRLLDCPYRWQPNSIVY
jgi:exopolyphosphatase/guanosine-5'-triphosphate,3'-diphosphate pyrophosphatase